jgi:hypothetical protein
MLGNSTSPLHRRERELKDVPSQRRDLQMRYARERHPRQKGADGRSLSFDPAMITTSVVSNSESASIPVCSANATKRASPAWW